MQMVEDGLIVMPISPPLFDPQPNYPLANKLKTKQIGKLLKCDKRGQIFIFLIRHFKTIASKCIIQLPNVNEKPHMH